MQTTPNLSLKKPESTDTVDIGDLNDNADILDAEVTKLASTTENGRMSAADKAVLSGATSAATASRMMIRDSAGRAQVAAPAAAADIARKDTVDAVQTNLNTHSGATTGIHGAVSAATASKIVIRDSSGRAKFAAPAASDDVALKSTVDDAIVMGMQRQSAINGNFDVWQRGNSFSGATNGYNADHFKNGTTGDVGMPNISISPLALTQEELPGSSYCCRVSTDGSGSGFNADTEFVQAQPIENGVRGLCGTDKKITLSFYARSNISGKRLGVSFVQRYGTGGSPSTDDILPGTIFNLASGWQKYSFTFATATLDGKTLGSNRDDYLQLKLWFAWGTSKASLYFGGGTAEDFGGTGNIDITQIQVNAGDTALPFQPRSFADELRLCQRYYEKSYNLSAVPGTASVQGSISGTVPVKSHTNLPLRFKVNKRIVPTVMVYDMDGNLGKINLGGSSNQSFTSITRIGEAGFYIVTDAVASNSDYEFHFVADAEL